MKREMYVIIPDVRETYEGIKVTKDTKIEFENDFVKQELKNLVLKTERIVEKDRFRSEIKTELKLNEGDLLLIEEENRGYFLPSDVSIGTPDEAIAEYEFLKEQIKKMNGE